MKNQATGEDIMALMHKRVLLLCAAFFYEGTIVDVDMHGGLLSAVVLEGGRKKRPQLVFNTGAFKEEAFAEADELPADQWRVRLSSIESYGIIDEPKNKKDK